MRETRGTITSLPGPDDHGTLGGVTDPVDLLVVGAGSAGLTAARTAAGLGARVVLVERDRPGGDCLATGCVPSKALLAAAARAHAMRDAARFGLAPAAVVVDWEEVRGFWRRAVDTLAPADSAASLRDDGVEVIMGPARFAGPDEAVVGARRIAFRRAVIATGAVPAVPPLPGLREALDEGLAVTSDTVWDLPTLPSSLVVLGAGAVGCELAQAFARLGTAVTLVETADRVLPGEIPHAGAALGARLAAEGVDVRTGVAATAVGPDDTRAHRVGADGGRDSRQRPLGAGRASLGAAPGAGVTVTLDEGTTVRAQRLLVAVGRRPDVTGLDPAAAGVVVGTRGEVVVDDRLRTANPRVFAAGDVTGGPAFTHLAGVAGSVAATNALLAPVRRLDPATVPRVTYTDPEVAAVGPADAAGTVRHLAHDRVDRAVIEDDTTGFVRVVEDARGRVRAATVVGPRAGETVVELAGLVARRGRLADLAGVIHPYPGWSDGVWTLAVDALTARLGRPVPARLGRLALAARRRFG